MKKINDLSKSSTLQLLHFYSDIMSELRVRKVIRTGNGPVADYAEYIIAELLGLELAGNSTASYDAHHPKTKLKYQIKSRRQTSYSKSRQLGVIRNLETADFDYLIAVIFDEQFKPIEIYQIRKPEIKKYGRFSEHQNGHILILRGKVLEDKNVKKLEF